MCSARSERPSTRHLQGPSRAGTNRAHSRVYPGPLPPRNRRPEQRAAAHRERGRCFSHRRPARTAGRLTAKERGGGGPPRRGRPAGGRCGGPPPPAAAA
jgi:hypothetical protein